MQRRIGIVGIVLGEDAHADLVEAGLGKRGERVVLHRHRLVRPGVAGGAERQIGRAVDIGEVVPVAHPYRSMNTLARRRRRKIAGQPVELGRARLRGKFPDTLRVRRKAYPVGAVAVVEARHLDLAVALADHRVERDIDKRIAPRRALGAELENVPASDVLAAHPHISLVIISISPLDRTGRKARDEVALEDQVDEDGGDDRHHDCGV